MVKGQPTNIVWINMVELETAMLYTKIRSQLFLGSEEEGFQECLPYMDVEAVLFNGSEPFE